MKSANDDPELDREDLDPQEIRNYAHEAANRGLVKLGSKQEHAEQQAIMQESSPYLTLGAQMAGSIAAFFGIGYWLDHHFGTSFWIPTLTGLGAAASLTYFIVTVVRLGNKEMKK
jgi:F0F1-type ATP synthase assembly protein I